MDWRDLYEGRKWCLVCFEFFYGNKPHCEAPMAKTVVGSNLNTKCGDLPGKKGGNPGAKGPGEYGKSGREGVRTPISGGSGKIPK